MVLMKAHRNGHLSQPWVVKEGYWKRVTSKKISEGNIWMEGRLHFSINILCHSVALKY